MIYSSSRRGWSPADPDSRPDCYGFGFTVNSSAARRPVPARPLDEYTGSYGNSFYGAAAVEVRAGELALLLGPDRVTVPMRHWDGDTFVFTPTGEGADPDIVSKATFDGDRLVLEYYDREGMGTFTRARPRRGLRSMGRS